MPRNPDLDRRRRHADGRSTRRRTASGRRSALVRRSVRAGILRRQGAAPKHDPAGRNGRIPVRILNTPASRRRQPDHGGAVLLGASGCRPGVQAASHRRRRRPRRACSWRTASCGVVFEVFETHAHLRGRGDDLRSQRLDDRGRRPPARGTSWRAAKFADVKVDRDMAIVSAVGDNLAPRPASRGAADCGARRVAAADGVAGGVAPEPDGRADRSRCAGRHEAAARGGLCFRRGSATMTGAGARRRVLLIGHGRMGRLVESLAARLRGRRRRARGPRQCRPSAELAAS